MHSLVIAVFLVAITIVGTALAANENRPESTASIPKKLLLNMAASKTREKYIAYLFRSFRGPAGNDQILDMQELEDDKNRAAANLRANRFKTLLQYDLNGDGAIVRDEVVAVLEMNGSSAGMLDDQVAVTMAMDTNKDGEVMFNEALEYLKRDIEQRQRTYGIHSTLEVLFSLDPNKDKKLTPEEVEQIGRTTFARFDSNNDGYLADNERTALDRLKNEIVRSQMLRLKQLRSKNAN